MYLNIPIKWSMIGLGLSRWLSGKESACNAAAAAKSLQSCPTLCDPVDGSPPGSPIPGILQAKTMEWAAISFSNAWKWKVKVKSLSHVWLLVTPWMAAHQAPPPMGSSRQEYWNGVPLPSPTCNAGDSFSIPDQGNPIDRGAWQPTVHGVAKSSDTIWQPNNKETMIE